MMHRASVLAVALSVAGAAFGGITVTSPESDSIVIGATTTIQGVSTDVSVCKVSVTRGAEKRLAEVEDGTGTWVVPDFPLALSLNKITVQAEPPQAGVGPMVFFVTRGKDIEKRPRQRVALAWDDDTDAELEAVARGTLDAQLDDAQIRTFINTVHAAVPEVLTRAYRLIADIELVVQGGENVHTVRFKGVDSGFYGLSPGDCGNRDLAQESEVFVGTYRDQIVGSFSEWKPMKKDDALDVRALDLAHALGRTAAHELGHSLGLVADQGPCVWMAGCDGFHSCFALQQIHSGLSRFGGGFFIMDPGPRSANQARIAEVTKAMRASRRPARFSHFDQNYLAVIHPVP
jgi:hypothetical protein